MMAEGRAFCESRRSALGGRYTLGKQYDNPNLLGDSGWWERPSSDGMPVRCHQGGWTARDRSDLDLVKDLLTTAEPR